jgi:hypothetical protein
MPVVFSRGIGQRAFQRQPAKFELFYSSMHFLDSVVALAI